MEMLKNNAFSTKTPYLQLVWDSTSLNLLKTCAYKYYLSMIEQWSSKHQAVPLSFGIAYHAALESYDKARAEGLDYDAATIAAVRKALEKSGTRNPDGSFTPWADSSNTRNRYTLCRAVVWYLEQFKNDSVKTVILSNGKPAVELSYRYGTGHFTAEGEEFELSGHLDRVVEFDNQRFIQDRKSTEQTITPKFFEKFSPDNQMSGYSLAGKVVFGIDTAGVMIDACQTAVSFTRFERGFASRTSAQLSEWFDDAMVWLKIAELYAVQQHWPMNDAACTLYGGCQFRPMCRKDPAVREVFLESNFEKKVWDPTEAR